ncbi:MAG: fructosamine kinase family protein [Pseudomonadota bacterium]
MRSEGKVFTKQVATPEAITCEVDGLNALSETLATHVINELKIPKVVAHSQTTLSLEHIQQIRSTPTHHIKLAKGLAQLHLVKQARYGWHQPNFIGASVQPNIITNDWGKFFVEHRLLFQVSKVADQQLREDYKFVLSKHKQSVEEFLDATCNGPSLVHGDLWQGNALFSDNEGVWLIDPAVYWGDREVDIAMTELFGGFSKVFYEHYNEYAPLSEHYPVKKQIFNLYHNLNHLNLFGSSYRKACDDGMSMIASLD